MKLANVLPDFARELSEGLAAMGHRDLAGAIFDVDIIERCACIEPGCVTFYAMPKDDAPRWPECERVIPPVMGVSCVYYQNGRVLWIEALGRPIDRATLDNNQPKQGAV